MPSGSTKKFLLFIFVALAILATFSMTPKQHYQTIMKPIQSIYNSDNKEDLSKLGELSQSNKVIVKPDDAQKESLNLEVDPSHPNQLLPADNKNDDVENLDFADTSIENEKIEVILDSVPL